MKKLLVLCVAFAFFLASCGNNVDDNSKQDNKKPTQSQPQRDDKNYSDFENEKFEDDFKNEELEDDFGFDESYSELRVVTDVSKPNAAEIRPAENTADLLNPEVMAFAGANKEALALRRNVLDAKDKISVTGTTYYVSPNGSDENDGKSPSRPLATLVNAFSKAKSGDAVLLERGSIFRLGNTVTIGNGVTCGAYGTGAKPEVWGSLENYAQPVRWSPFTIRNVWMIDCSLSDVGIIVFNHGELAGNMKYYVRNLEKNGDYFFDDVQKVLYLYCDKGNPGKAFNDIEIGCRMVLFRLRDGAKDVTINNIAFKYTGTFGIHGSYGCTNINITDCIVGWVGGSLFANSSNRYGNGIEFLAGCQNVNVDNCWIYQVYDAGFTFQTNPADGKENHRLYKNITLKNSLIEYCSWAFEWWPSDSNCKVEDISITGNILRFSGYGWAGDTRSPSHIRGPWSAKTFIPKNFAISNNIFDCSNGPVYAWALDNAEQYGDQLLGNTYYQKSPTSSRNITFEIIHNRDGSGALYAHNQSELEAIVKSIDPKAKLIKWLN